MTSLLSKPSLRDLMARMTSVSRLLRLLALFVLSKALLETSIGKRLVALFWKDQTPSDKSKVTPVPFARPPKNPILGFLLGHFADVKPWKSESFGIDVFNYRNNWYEQTKGKPKSIQVRLATDQVIFTHDLDVIKAISGKEDRLFRNSDTVRKGWGPLFPTSVSILTGDTWKRIRRVFVSAVSKLDLESLPPLTNSVLEKCFDKYITEPEQEVVLWDVFSKVTFDSFHKFAYDVDFNTVSGENLNVLEDCIELADIAANRLFISVPFIWKLPTQTNRRLWAAHKRLCDFIDSFIEESTEKYIKRKAAGELDNTAPNLLDAFIMASFQDAEATSGPNNKKNKRLSKDELRDQLGGAMFAGFDTTSSSTSFVLDKLAAHPECQEKLYEEVKDIDLSKATKSQLSDLPYLNSVIKEVLRLQGAAPAVARVPNTNVVINGHLIKEGTQMLLDHEKLGQIPEHWNGATDLAEFKPERWINFTPKKNTFFPFGFGGRQCPGQKIGLTQLQIIITYMTQNFIVSPSSTPIRVIAALGRTVTKDSTLVFKRRTS